MHTDVKKCLCVASINTGSWRPFGRVQAKVRVLTQSTYPITYFHYFYYSLDDKY